MCVILYVIIFHNSNILAGWNVELFCSIFSLKSLKKVLTLSQAERARRQPFQIQWKLQQVLQTGRKPCQRGNNCLLQAISPFSQYFQKTYTADRHKPEIVLERADKMCCVKNESVHFSLHNPYRLISFKTFTKWHIYRLVQIENICRRQFKYFK